MDDWEEQSLTWHQSLVENAADMPRSDIEWLMQLGEQPADTTDWGLVDLVQDCTEHMTPQYKLLIQMLFYDRYSYNEITEMLGYSSKSHTWYHVRKALVELKQLLLEHPKIKELYGHDNH